MRPNEYTYCSQARKHQRHMLHITTLPITHTVTHLAMAHCAWQIDARTDSSTISCMNSRATTAIATHPTAASYMTAQWYACLAFRVWLPQAQMARSTRYMSINFEHGAARRYKTTRNYAFTPFITKSSVFLAKRLAMFRPAMTV